MKFDVKLAISASLLGVLLGAASAGAEPTIQAKVAETPSTPFQFFEDETPGATKRSPGAGVELTIAPGSSVRQLPSTRLALGGQSKRLAYVFQVSRGRVDASISADRVGRVAVVLVGPGGHTGVVHQGHGAVVTWSDAMSFSAIDGAMVTGRGSSWQQLPSGRGRYVDLAGKLRRDYPLPKPPSVAVEEPLGLAIPGHGFTTPVWLTPSKEAEHYEVALFERSKAFFSLVSRFKTDTPVATVSTNRPGHYVVVARAVDRFGVASDASPPKALRVMGISLPKGAVASNNKVRIAPQRRVGLVAVDGLEMTYGTGDFFVPAPDSIGLFRSSPTRVRFRDAESRDELTLTLLPQVVHTTLEVGPKSASWPGDPVEIHVHAFDANDQPLTDTKALSAKVSVNLEPMHVTWHRDKNTLSTTLVQPKGLPGPWVVRVTVSHESVGAVGRDFLEVAQSSGN